MGDAPILKRRLAYKSKVLKKNIKNSKKLYGKNKPFLGKLFTPMTISNVEVEGKKEALNLLDVIRASKITGFSGDEFLTILKLEKIDQYIGKRILVVNAIECEPALVHDDLLVGSYLEEIKAGIQEIKDALKIEEAYLAIKKIDEVDLQDEICYTKYLDFTYPLGEEHKLIQAVLGLDVEGYTADCGILVLNVQTVYQIHRLMTQTFDGGKFITLGSLEDGKADAIYVQKGEKVLDIVSRYYPNTKLDIYAGKGVFRAHKVSAAEVIDEKITFICLSNITVSTTEQKCKGCGKCSRNCPQQLNVKAMVRLREKDKNANISAFHPEKCLKCGLCVWNCPANKMIGAYLN